jgi:hypothetical protein
MTNRRMTFTDVIIALEDLVIWRLFNSPRWLADRETCSAIHRRLVDLGLQVDFPDGTIITTPLGARIQIGLVSVFAGVHEEYEVPMILEQHGLIDECDAETLFDHLFRSDVDADQLLRPAVQAAYRRHSFFPR